MKNKILIIIKDKDGREDENLFLDMDAEVCYTKNMQDAMRRLSLIPYQLILIAGFEPIDLTCHVTQATRKMQKAPIIILGAESMKDRLQCIEVGADVALPDACSKDEIRLQAQALIRRYTEWMTDNCERIDVIQERPLTIDSIRHKVFWKGQEVKLTSREFDFLYLLAAAPGRVYTFEQIYRKVWKEYCHGDISNIVWCLLRRVREKLKKIEPKAAEIIKSVRNVGYYFELHNVED